MPEVSVTLAGKEAFRSEVILAMIRAASHRDVPDGLDDPENSEKAPSQDAEDMDVAPVSSEAVVAPSNSESASSPASFEWTRAHSFIVQMGGFYLYTDGIPIRSLSEEDMALLIWRGYTPPSAEDINDRSKGDWFSKGVAVLQTFWYVVQCIARRAQHLAITQLEVVTISYCAINLIIYLFWWNKPLDIARPFRIDVAPFLDKVPDDFCMPRYKPNTIWQQVGHLAANEWHGESEPGTFFPATESWKNRPTPPGTPPFRTQLLRVLAGKSSGKPRMEDSEQRWQEMESYMISGGGALLLAFLFIGLIFGALHFIAWSASFPSHSQHVMWRVCCIVLICVPAMVPAILFLLSVPKKKAGKKASLLIAGILALVYFLARLSTMVLSLITLGNLPLSAVQTVQWTSFIPHY
ncbi:hypothetical protein HWV62_23444 [Athelia sp. TMB]|nr:hypothetical protein HWV62_23444 [Athelia sp. TMB]